MNPYLLTNCSVTGAAIFLLYLFLWRPLMRDRFRADIRKIRDELFDYVWMHGHSFNDQTYIDARQELNGLLRVSRHLFLAGMAITAWHVLSLSAKGLYEPRTCDPCETPHDLRDRVALARSCASKRIVRFLLNQGPLGWLLWMVIVVAITLRITRLTHFKRRLGLRVLDEAREFGATPINHRLAMIIGGNSKPLGLMG